jgi:hypothetical protein
MTADQRGMMYGLWVVCALMMGWIGWRETTIESLQAQQAGIRQSRDPIPWEEIFTDYPNHDIVDRTGSMNKLRREQTIHRDSIGSLQKRIQKLEKDSPGPEIQQLQGQVQDLQNRTGKLEVFAQPNSKSATRVDTELNVRAHDAMISDLRRYTEVIKEAVRDLQKRAKKLEDKEEKKP